ncbi:Predicted small integral membrane protein [Palleronia salina]|uniref:Predicted small integral membrane protein n=2 Tax=Palleronia TaxID=315422 RepID=A0A1M6L7H4_9RHOB|nr:MULTISPECIES: DUF2160 domain-containing protein [Palleronia]SEN69571.1 Predicted small integral membrane protein [Palleronia pelagia]SHJ67152.1 Predicted small integral membrane protein [Palleronia salina]
MSETAKSDLTRKQNIAFAAMIVPWVLVGIYVFFQIPRDEGEILWTESLNPGGWMAWVFPTATFFWVVAGILIAFSILAIRFPETPKRGILGIETTRGDRLFISLLIAGFLNLAWLGLEIGPQYLALVVSLVIAGGIFRYA